MCWRRILCSLRRLEKWAGNKGNRMKLSRKQSTVTRRNSYTNAMQGPAAPEEGGGLQIKFNPLCCCTQSFMKARTRAQPRYLVLTRLQAQHKQHIQLSILQGARHRTDGTYARRCSSQEPPKEQGLISSEGGKK